jgi:hypothetical protein
MLCDLKEASALIETGRSLAIAGCAALLGRLPRGNWIGGTTPYLMSGTSSGESAGRLLVTAMPIEFEFVRVQRYGVGGIEYVVEDSPSDGFSLVIMPSGSEVQQMFAKQALRFWGTFDKSVVGWVSGVTGNRLNERPQVFHGPTGHCIEDEIVTLHMRLPRGMKPTIEVINIFEEGEGDVIEFISDGFTATYALIDGEIVPFSKYLVEKRINFPLPMVATLGGRKYNVSVGGYETDSGKVKFFAPVFHGVPYKFAKPVANLASRLRGSLPVDGADVVFGCVCMGNFMDGALAGYAENHFEGPVSYGEIAHIMTNQCVVRLRVSGNP